MDTQPFRIAIGDDALRDLRERLSRVRWPATLPGTGWTEGTDSDFLKRLVTYWRDRFDWRAQEARLNTLPQFMAEVEGQQIHFVHQRGIGPDPLPLLITHGWPGSFIEMAEIIPLLTEPEKHGGDAKDAFDVIVPSLPGYAFSPAPLKPGTGPAHVARLWAKLMEGLGQDRYGVQGGDWGASVSTWLAYQQPARVAGVHLNFIPGSFRPPLGPTEAPISAEEEEFLARGRVWADAEGAYGHIQGTKPQTLAFGLNDSPVGLAAWIVEKFQAWSDCAGHVEQAFSMDALLTGISLYWYTGTIGSSFRMYLENRRSPVRFESGQRVAVPLGVAQFPHELPMPPRSWVERVFDVQRWTRMPRGGHFAAMEAPQDLAEELRAFFRPLRR